MCKCENCIKNYVHAVLVAAVFFFLFLFFHCSPSTIALLAYASERIASELSAHLMWRKNEYEYLISHPLQFILFIRFSCFRYVTTFVRSYEWEIDVYVLSDSGKPSGALLRIVRNCDRMTFFYSVSVSFSLPSSSRWCIRTFFKSHMNCIRGFFFI